MPTTYLIIGVSFILIYVSQKLLAFWNAIRLVGNHPGKRLVFSPFMGMFLPKIKYFTTGSNHDMDEKHEPFVSAGWDICTIVTALPNATTLISVADAEAIKQITKLRTRFPKPVEYYEPMNMYGKNIVASEGDDWKKYRKISAPAFSDRNNKLVWDETVDIVNDLVNKSWKGRDVIELDNFVEITASIALFVIGAAGFGIKMSWNADKKAPKGHSMTFKESLHTVTADILWKVACPDWMMSFTKGLRKTRLAFQELRMYMVEMINERQLGGNVEWHDLFSMLLKENADADDLGTLNEDELMGNVYAFLVAGHETTGNTLGFAFALLALYPDEQEKLFEHVRSVISDGRDPKYEDMRLLTRTLAVLYETLRMFPVATIPKQSVEDTSLVATNANDESLIVPVPKGAIISISVAGLHYNPRYWEDPYSFKPERFLKDWPRDAFVPFSAAARACLGKKFFETEAVAVLSMLVSQYKITIKEEPEFARETFEQKKARVLANRSLLVLKPTRIPLVFTRRI